MLVYWETINIFSCYLVLSNLQRGIYWASWLFREISLILQLIVTVGKMKCWQKQTEQNIKTRQLYRVEKITPSKGIHVLFPQNYECYILSQDRIVLDVIIRKLTWGDCPGWSGWLLTAISYKYPYKREAERNLIHVQRRRLREDGIERELKMPTLKMAVKQVQATECGQPPEPGGGQQGVLPWSL